MKVCVYVHTDRKLEPKFEYFLKNKYYNDHRSNKMANLRCLVFSIINYQLHCLNTNKIDFVETVYNFKKLFRLL